MHIATRIICLLSLFSLSVGSANPGTLIFKSKKSSFERRLKPINVKSVDASKDQKTTMTTASVKSAKAIASTNSAFKGMQFSDTRLDYSNKKSVKIIKTSIGAVFFVAGCLLGVGMVRKSR